MVRLNLGYKDGVYKKKGHKNVCDRKYSKIKFS